MPKSIPIASLLLSLYCASAALGQCRIDIGFQHHLPAEDLRIDLASRRVSGEEGLLVLALPPEVLGDASIEPRFELRSDDDSVPAKFSLVNSKREHLVLARFGEELCRVAASRTELSLALSLVRDGTTKELRRWPQIKLFEEPPLPGSIVFLR